MSAILPSFSLRSDKDPHMIQSPRSKCLPLYTWKPSWRKSDMPIHWIASKECLVELAHPVTATLEIKDLPYVGLGKYTPPHPFLGECLRHRGSGNIEKTVPIVCLQREQSCKYLLWFGCVIPPTPGSWVWTLGPQVAGLLWEIVEPLRHGAW